MPAPNAQIAVDLRLDTQQLTAFFNHLTPSEIRRATTRAINVSLQKSKTRMKRDVVSVYTLPSGLVNNKSLASKRANYTNLTGTVLANARAESLGHFKFSGYASLIGGGHVRTGKKGAKTNQRNTRKSGVYVEVVKGQKPEPIAAFVLFKGGKPLIMARGKYAGSQGFQFGKPRLPISALNSKSVYFGLLHNQTVTRWMPYTRDQYFKELNRQLQGAVFHGVRP